MQKVFEKIIERMKEERLGGRADAGSKAIEIVNQVASEYGKEVNEPSGIVETVRGERIDCEVPSDYFNRVKEVRVIDEWTEETKVFKEEYGGGWIPVSSGKLPEERESIFAKFKGTDKWNDAMFEKISDEVNVTVVSEKGNATTAHAHTEDGKWSCDLLEVNKTYRVIAWQPLPKPYQPNICNDTDCPYNDRKECPASEGCAGYERR